MQDKKELIAFLYSIVESTIDSTSINGDFLADGGGSHFGLEYIYFTDSETKQ